jgi:hypothetical protein
MTAPRSFVIALGVLLTLAGPPLATAQTEELRPTLSIVDYLKSKKQRSDLKDREQLFAANFPREKYTGSEQQNVRLLVALVGRDEQAIEKAQKAVKAARNASEKESKPAGAHHVHDDKFCPTYGLGEGIGINGSYGFSVDVYIKGDKIAAEDFVVALNSASGDLGSLDLVGTVSIFVEGMSKPISAFKLEPAWFDTVGRNDPTTVFRYARKGTEIVLPVGKKIHAEISLNPVVKTDAGVVPLWACTRKIELLK